MVARCDLRHDPAEFFVRGNLRRDLTGKQFVPGVIVAHAQDRHGGLIAGGFNGQDRCHNLIVGQALRLPNRDNRGGNPTISSERGYFFTASAFGALCCA